MLETQGTVLRASLSCVPCLPACRLPGLGCVNTGRRHRQILYSLELRLALPVHVAPVSVSQAFIKCLGRTGTKLRALPLEPRALVLPWQQLTVTVEGMRAGA